MGILVKEYLVQKEFVFFVQLASSLRTACVLLAFCLRTACVLFSVQLAPPENLGVLTEQNEISVPFPQTFQLFYFYGSKKMF
jgi:hypothetical protein